MLQYLLNDYLPNYNLPSLRKLVVSRYGYRWVLHPTKINTYSVSVLPRGEVIIEDKVDRCKGGIMAIRMLNNADAIGLLDDATEWVMMVNTFNSPSPYKDLTELIRLYLA